MKQLKGRIDEGKLDIQKMLVPEPVDLSGPEAAAVIENRELLADLGIFGRAVWRRHGPGKRLSGDPFEVGPFRAFTRVAQCSFGRGP